MRQITGLDVVIELDSLAALNYSPKVMRQVSVEAMSGVHERVGSVEN
jgi:hypothetical protein